MQIKFSSRLTMLSTQDLSRTMNNNDIPTDDIMHYMLNGGYLLLLVNSCICQNKKQLFCHKAWTISLHINNLIQICLLFLLGFYEQTVQTR